MTGQRNCEYTTGTMISAMISPLIFVTVSHQGAVWTSGVIWRGKYEMKRSSKKKNGNTQTSFLEGQDYSGWDTST